MALQTPSACPQPTPRISAAALHPRCGETPGLDELGLILSGAQHLGQAGLSPAGRRLQPGGPLGHLPEGREQTSKCLRDLPVLHEDRTWLVSAPCKKAVCSWLVSGAEVTFHTPEVPGDGHRQPPRVAEQTQGSSGER